MQDGVAKTEEVNVEEGEIVKGTVEVDKNESERKKMEYEK
jgi:hypothetical protein